MRLLVLTLAITAVAMQTTEPPPYPQGWYCTPTGILRDGKPSTDHPCSCRRMNTAPNCDDPAFDSHDPQCSQYCSETGHCACPIECEASKSVRFTIKYGPGCSGPGIYVVGVDE